MSLPHTKSDRLESQSSFLSDMYTLKRRHSRALRVLALVFLASFFYLATTHPSSTPFWGGKAEIMELEGHDAVTPQEMNIQHKKSRPRLEPVKPEVPVVDSTYERQQEVEEAEEIHTPALKVSAPGNTDPTTLRFQNGLKQIFAIMPDEIHVRELLREIEGSGKERLRETGVRARAFRSLFEPWEELHLQFDMDNTYVRDDVLSYLRKTKDLASISTKLTRSDMIRAYENYRYFLTRLSALLFPWTAPYFSDHMTLHAHIRHGGRGIVLSAGDGQLQYIMTSIKTFRKLGCDLPIEIMYLGDDDLGDDARGELESLPNVVTRDMKQMVNDKGWDLKGWAGKPFAILLSSFREVLFIDADALFLSNPANLFEDEAYVETGALFFRDRLMFPESKKKWLQQILPKPVSKNVRHSRFWTGESGHMQESGVLLVDKWKHFMALLMVTRMNGPDRDGDKDKGIIGTYDMMYGDKETFWLGWELVGDTGYAFHSGDCGNMGVAIADRGDSPKIAATAAKIGKHEELGALAGVYETSLFNDGASDDLSKEIEGETPEEEAAEPDTEEGEAKSDESADKDAQEDATPEDTETSDAALTQDEAFEEPITAEDEEEEGADETKVDTYEEKDPEAEVDEEAQEDPAEKRPIVKRGATTGGKSKARPAPGKAEKIMDTNDNEDLDLPSPRGQPVPYPESMMETNYTICAPQLLHLDRQGKPLWFNGWILENKFTEPGQLPSLSSFNAYMREKREDDSYGDWTLQESNMCCLRSDKLHKFTAKEKDTLKMIVATAREVGALDRQKAS